MKIKEINFNNKTYVYTYDENDTSGLGCESEIVKNNEYGLSRFNGIEEETFIDIGANHGLATIILAKQNPLSKIYSFEPNPHLFQILKTNINDNNLNNVLPINKGVHSDKNLKLIKNSHCSGASIMGDGVSKMDAYYKNQKSVEISVETISFDDFLTESKIDRIFLLKIDCEGSEYDILGNSELLFDKTSISNIVGEFHDLSYNNVNMTSNDLMEICNKNIMGIRDIKILKMI